MKLIQYISCLCYLMVDYPYLLSEKVYSMKAIQLFPVLTEHNQNCKGLNFIDQYGGNMSFVFFTILLNDKNNPIK